MTFFAQLLRAVRAIAAGWVVICFAVMTIAVWAQVGGRYIFNYSIAWTEEVATIAQIWMVLVGAGIAARQQLHAKIDILVTKLPRRLQRVVVGATTALSLWFLVSVVIGSIPLIEFGRFQTTPALGLPMLVPYLGLVIGPAYFALEIFAAAVLGTIYAADHDAAARADVV